MEWIAIDPDDGEAVADLMLDEEWPYHSAGSLDRAAFVERVRTGWYWSDSLRAFWIVVDGERAGLVQLRDLGDPTPMFDLRLRAAFRRRGIGTATVRWLTDYLYSEFPAITRIEGNTRFDNTGMRRAFERCGWVWEAHYRLAWPDLDGTLVDAVGYAIIRPDWMSGAAARDAGHLVDAAAGRAAQGSAGDDGRALQLCTALLDVERLAIAGRLAVADASAEELAAALKMKLPRVVRQLERLRDAGLAAASVADGHTRWGLDRTALDATARDLAPRAAANDDAGSTELRGIIEGDRLLVMPAKHGKRMLALAWLAAKFDEDVEYPEAELNQRLAVHHPDFASLRRALVDYRFMTREAGVYRLAPDAMPDEAMAGSSE